jgi:hypothetical protein
VTPTPTNTTTNTQTPTNTPTRTPTNTPTPTKTRNPILLYPANRVNLISVDSDGTQNSSTSINNILNGTYGAQIKAGGLARIVIRCGSWCSGGTALNNVPALGSIGGSDAFGNGAQAWGKTVGTSTNVNKQRCGAIIIDNILFSGGILYGNVRSNDTRSLAAGSNNTNTNATTGENSVISSATSNSGGRVQLSGMNIFIRSTKSLASGITGRSGVWVDLVLNNVFG